MEFKNAMIAESNLSLTDNGMKAYKSSLDANVDLFYQIGASRGRNITNLFSKAYNEDSSIALRIALWVRDIRGGAGERQLFRDILNYLEKVDLEATKKLMNKVSLVGRYDDLLCLTTLEAKNYAFSLIKEALDSNNALAAKWMPRKGKIAKELRHFLGFKTEKDYRKFIVAKTQVVETLMCKKQWNEIDFAKVPSLASIRYRKAFERNAEDNYAQYIQLLEEGKSKVNASAVYPYDLFKGMDELSSQEKKLIQAQWKALPNFLNGNNKIFPMVDVSPSMRSDINNSLTCMDVAISLGLYIADKNTGSFANMFLTFSEDPEIVVLQDELSIVEKYLAIERSSWAGSTDIEKAMNKLLDVAVKHNVKKEEMPETLLILSDMQFDAAQNGDLSFLEMTKELYGSKGYVVPKIVFWNLNAKGNYPALSNESNVAMVSGFSPSVLKAVLADNLENYTPKNVMLEAISSERYDI